MTTSTPKQGLQFNFQIPTNIVFGTGSLDSIDAHVKEMGVKKPLLVTDKVVGQSEGVKRALARLKESGIPAVMWDGISAEPTGESIREGIRRYRAEGCDGLIGFGGGSSMDCAKAIGVLAVAGGDDATVFVAKGGTREVKGCPPIIAVPTTSGTGSEVTAVSVVINQSTNYKLPIRHPSLMPRVAIVDPSLMVSMPRGVTISTGVDALSHATECFTLVREHPFADTLALQAIELIAANLKRAAENGNDVVARTHMALAATMAGTAFNIGGLQFHTHAQVLGGRYRLPHGITCGIALRAGLHYILPTATGKLARLCRAFGVDTSGLSTAQAAERGVEAVAELLDALEVPTVTEAAPLTEADIPSLVQETIDTSSRPLSREAAVGIWEEMFRQVKRS